MLSRSARQEYLHDLHAEYCRSAKPEKGRILDEAGKRTGLDRKVLIRTLSPAHAFTPRQRKRRPATYDGAVLAALVKVWEVFALPCGQRLKPLLVPEIPRLRALGELRCSDVVAEKLQRMGSATIDRKLKREKTLRRLSRYRTPPVHPLLHQVIPVKTPDEWDREEPGQIQLDYVAHSGSSAAGEFCHTLSAAEIAFGWWEGTAIQGRSQRATQEALAAIRTRLPVPLMEIHPDNDSGMINNLVWRYCDEEDIRFSRSRPHHKNDNAWVEQRNWSHVRKMVGYLRYDTPEERACLNALYADLARFKNFFQPTMKLVRKERIGGRIRRRYDEPRTPYQRVLASDRVAPEAKERLRRQYASLNPAALKRRVEAKRDELVRLYEATRARETAGETLRVPMKKLTPRSVTSLVIQPMAVR